MTVTVAAVTDTAPDRAGPLLAMARAALPVACGRAALLLPPLPRLAASMTRWRMAETILQTAASGGGGAVLRSAAGGSLLLGTSPAAAARASAALGHLAGEQAPLPVWPLPEEMAAVLDWAAKQAPAAPAGTVPSDSSLSGLHRTIDALPADAVLRAETLVSPAGAAVGRRLLLSRPCIAAALGSLATDPDLLGHAEDRLAARLLPGLGAWAQDLPGLRLIPLPYGHLPPPAGKPGAIGVLPVQAAAAPNFTGYRVGLADRGWGLALDGLDAARLDLLDLARLPADLLLLRWSPALEEAAVAGLRAACPAQLVLTGTGEVEAFGLARRHGLLLARAA